MEIPKKIYDQLIEEARREAPLECCGYLAGTGKKIVRAYPMTNVDASAIHYSFDPKEQFRTVKEVRKADLTVLAVYHSHPETPARPSEEDIRLAYDPNVSHVIISLCGEVEDVKSFTIKDGQAEQEELSIQ